MEVAVDREQAVAHQPDQVAEVAVAPEKVRGVRDEQVVVRLGTQHEHDVRVEQAQREDRAEALVVVEQHRQRFVGEAFRAREREAGFPWRERHRRALAAQVFEHHLQRVHVEHRAGAHKRHSAKASRWAGWVASFAGLVRWCEARDAALPQRVQQVESYGQGRGQWRAAPRSLHCRPAAPGGRGGPAGLLLGIQGWAELGRRIGPGLAYWRRARRRGAARPIAGA